MRKPNDDPMVDIVTTHHYPKRAQEMIDQVKAYRAKSKGKKPYFVGEFGFVETDGVRDFLDTVVANGTSGVLIWSLRYRSRDGGFYWHSEPFGGDRYKAYHWPVLFEARLDAADSRFVKIEFAGEIQISRVEIAYGGAR